MSRMLLLPSMILTLALCCGLVYSLPPNSESGNENPSWCREGYVCLTADEAANLSLRLIGLNELIDVERAKRLRRFGMTGGCGIGADMGDSYDPNITCGLYWGYRWDWGRR